MRKLFLIVFLLLAITSCTKSTIRKNGCADPPLTGDLCLPNIFTPNGDQINDTLFVRQSTGHPQIVSLDFKISDSEGTILYSATDPRKGWDGTYNGEVISGVYQTQVYATMSNGTTVDFKGTVTCLGKKPKKHLINNCTECRFDSQFNGNGNFDPSLPSNETSEICE